MVDSPTFVRRARRSGSRSCADLAAGRGLGRLGRFRGDGRVCDQLGGWLRGLVLTPPRLAVRCQQLTQAERPTAR
jgi:hypothetical protein